MRFVFVWNSAEIHSAPPTHHKSFRDAPILEHPVFYCAEFCPPSRGRGLLLGASETQMSSFLILPVGALTVQPFWSVTEPLTVPSGAYLKLSAWVCAIMFYFATTFKFTLFCSTRGITARCGSSVRHSNAG